WYALIRKGLAENLGEAVREIDPAESPSANDNKPQAEVKAAPAAKGYAPEEAPAEKILRFEVKQTANAQPDGVKPLGKKRTTGMPVWAREMPRADQTPVEKFRPSEYKGTRDNYSAASPLDGAGEM